MIMARKFSHLDEWDKQYIRDNIGKMSQREIAKRIGCHPNTVQYFLKKENVEYKGLERWTPQRRNEILRLRMQGLTTREIACRLGIKRNAVRGQWCIMRKQGIKLPYLQELLKIRKNKQKE